MRRSITSATSPPRLASTSPTTTEPSERSGCRKPWAPAAPSSITTTTAFPTFCWSTDRTGPAIPKAGATTLKLYHNNHDGTFTDVTREIRPRHFAVRHGRCRRRLRQRRLRRHFHYRRRPEPSLPQQRQRYFHRRDEIRRTLGPERILHRRRLGRLRSRRQTRSRRRQLRAVVRAGRSLLHARWCAQILLHARIV